jgi:hypothetical protein
MFFRPSIERSDIRPDEFVREVIKIAADAKTHCQKMRFTVESEIFRLRGAISQVALTF